MNLSKILEILNKYWRLATLIGLVLFGIWFVYFIKANAQDYIEGRIARAVESGMEIQYNKLAKQIEVQGKKLDSSGTYLAGVRYLADPGFFTKLFDKNAREQARLRDQLLSDIPQSVKDAFKQYGQKPAEIGITDVVIDSAYFEVRVGNSVKFARGALVYHAPADSAPYYSLTLYTDTLEIKEVRSTPQPDGTLLSTVTAISKLTGQQYQATSNRYMLEWQKPAWDWHPYLSASVGPLLRYEGGLAATGDLGIDWIKYTTPRITWNALQARVTPDGLAVKTEWKYKLFGD